MNIDEIKEYIKENGLDSKCRKRELVYRRYYLYYFLYEMRGMSLSNIGKLFNRDHATIIFGLKQYHNLKNYSDFIEITAMDFLNLPIIENNRDRNTLNRTPIYWTREEYKHILDTRIKNGFETNVEAIKFLVNGNILKN